MKFKNLTIQNFMSIQHIIVDLENQGLVLLKGRNMDNESLNNNGAGKSSIIEALIYALYGKTIRGVKGDAVIHRIPKKNMKIWLDIEDDDGTQYRIARYRKHATNKNKSLLYRNGKDITPKSESDFNDYVAELLQADYLTFTSSLLYSAESFKFTSATDAEMKHTFDTMLGLDIYQRCQDIAKAQLKQVDSEIRNITYDINGEVSSIEALQQDIEDNQLRAKEYEVSKDNQLKELADNAKKYQQRIQELNAGIAEQNDEIAAIREQQSATQARLDKVNEQLDQLGELDEELQELSHQSHKVERQLNSQDTAISREKQRIKELERDNQYHRKHILSFEDKLNALQEDIGSPCPTCGAPLTAEALEPARQECLERIQDEQHQIKDNDNQIAKAQQSIEQLGADVSAKKQELADIDAEIEELQELVSVQVKLKKKQSRLSESLSQIRFSIQSITNNVKSDQKTIESYEEFIFNTNSQAETLRQEKAANPYRDTIQKSMTDIQGHQDKLNEYNVRIVELNDSRECLQFWVGAYSNQGIKSLVLDDITPFLNRRANKYLSRLSSGQIEVKFSTQTTLKNGDKREKFSIEVVNQDGGQEYIANSGGERKRIDLAINLAMQDLVASRSSKRINLAIFDEVFDALDEVGVEKVIELLQEISEEKSTIIVISHNEHLQSYFTNILTVVKQNGFSTLSQKSEETDGDLEPSDLL